jgi:hypothetical protein
MNTIDKAEQDKSQAQQIIAAIPLIPEVQGIDVELYTDNTGDPAFQLIFLVRPNVEVGEEFIKRFNGFAREVQTKILHSDLQRFPYTRIKQVA